MPDIEATFGPTVGRLSVARVTYQCDLQRRGGLVIPLGTLAEVVLGPVRVLGLLARTSLLTPESEAIAPLMRGQLADPFGMLKEEFEWAWKDTAPGEALQALAARHAESLLFSPPTVGTFKDQAVRTLDGLVEEAKQKTRDSRDEEFRNLIVEIWSKPRVVSQEEMARLAA